MTCPSYLRLWSLQKDGMLNVFLQVFINGPTLAEADSIIQDSTKVGAHYIVTFPITLHTCLPLHVLVVLVVPLAI